MGSRRENGFTFPFIPSIPLKTNQLPSYELRLAIPCLIQCRLDLMWLRLPGHQSVPAKRFSFWLGNSHIFVSRDPPRWALTPGLLGASGMPSHSDYGFFTVPEPRLVHIWIFTPGGRLPTHCIILHNSSRYILPSSKWWHKGYLVHGSPNWTEIIGGVFLARRATLLSLSLLSLAHSPSLKIFTRSASTSYFQKVWFTSFVVLACLNGFSSFQLCEQWTTCIWPLT